MGNVRLSYVASLVLVLATCFGSAAAFAQQPLLPISHSISASGTTLLRLSGPFFNGCVVPDQSSVVVAPGSITVNTLTHLLPCFGVPPPGFIDITVDVGFLPIGHYDVNWYWGSPSTLIGSTQFDVVTAPVAQPIPTVGEYALLISLIALAISGMLSLRGRSRYVTGGARD